MKTKLFLATIALVLSGIVLLSFTYVQKTQKPWPTPEKYQKMKNTVKSDAASIAEGKALWNKHCKSCHGAKGLGDGTKAASLETFPGNFTKPDFKALGDGVIYYRSFVGRDEMPNFEKKVLEDSDRWALVNFIKSL
jgi:mono/diheme cytochrome c family protein